jgi:hypothetical protein
MHCQVVSSSVGSINSTSIAPPVGRVPCRRAEMTSASFTTRRSPERNQSPSVWTAACVYDPLERSTTNIRLSSRAESGCWAISAGSSA